MNLTQNRWIFLNYNFIKYGLNYRYCEKLVQRKFDEQRRKQKAGAKEVADLVAEPKVATYTDSHTRQGYAISQPLLVYFILFFVILFLFSRTKMVI